MTWNDLINELLQIPEDRREEKAIFMIEAEGFTIDAREERDLDSIDCDGDAGNFDDYTTFVLTC